MIILREYPPNYSDIKQILKSVPESMIFTFGSTIYNPSGNEISPNLMAHEEQHMAQQGNDPTIWWRRYLIDPAFRASQEIPAYQVQYQALKREVKDRNKLHTYLMFLASELSGPAYGEILSFQEAYEAIKRQELYTFKI